LADHLSAGRRLTAAAVACLACAMAAGCATLPTRGQALPVREPASGNGQGADFPQLIPAPPGKGWSPEQIVSGFLAASGSFAQNHAYARKYLAPQAARTWDPGQAVTVVSGPIKTKLVHTPEHVTGQPPDTHRGASVQVYGAQVASISASGQYQQVASGPAPKTVFKLTKINGQWRILNPPNRLLLSNSEFHRVYQPRNLYYFNSDSTILVPDPVFVPLQATTTDLATQLVKALLQQPLGWLQGATQTSLPPGTRLMGDVKIEGSGAVVNLGGTIIGASATTIEDVAAQLVWTLTSPSYGPSAITSVRLEFNGEPQAIPGATGGIALRKNPAYARMAPVPSSDAGLFFVASDGTVQTLPASGSASPQAVHGAAGNGSVLMSAIAVAPARDDAPDTPQYLAGISGHGRVIQIGELSRNAQLRAWQPGGKVTSLSWDRDSNLWAATSKGVWLLRPGGRPPIAVDLPFDGSQRVAMLRVAPDGVRVAMVVTGQDHPQVMVGAIAHSGAAASIGTPVQVGAKVADPAAVSWYDADNLAVLASVGTSAARIDEVPVNGGRPTEIVPERRLISLSVGGGQIAVGLAGGHMSTYAVSTDSWRALPDGQEPTYPG
jgi:lipoprotein LpqB-like beta-propeller protein/sporulation and spore germination protein